MAKDKKINAGIKGGQTWTRVTGANIEPQHKERGLVNKTRVEAPDFKKACEMAGIPVTKRQSSKWNNKKGAAYNVANRIDMNGFVIPAVS